MAQDKSCTDVGSAGTGNSYSTVILSQRDGGRFSGDQRQKKGGKKKKERKERLKAEKKKERQNKPLKSKRKCMSEISIRKHGRGPKGGSGENKNKRAKNVQGGKRQITQKSLGGKNEGGGSG